jgi:ribosomal protein L11 methyltransferase
MGRWVEVSIQVDPGLVEPVSAAVMASGCAGVSVSQQGGVSADPFAVHPPAEAWPVDTPATVSAFFPLDDRVDATMADVKRRLTVLREAGIPVPLDLNLRVRDEEDWAHAWKAHFKPIRVGRRLVVKPTWEWWDAAPDDVVLEIDPAMAFGSGAHPSTRLCLSLLESLDPIPRRVLDWGTGSGILALAAVRLGAGEVLAIDLDPVAAHTAAENVVQNNLEPWIRTLTASIEDVRDEYPFDLVLANIVADPIIEHAVDLRAALAPGGLTIVAGIIDLREQDVVDALTAQGLEVVERRAEEEWRALLLRREACSQS